MQSSLHTSFLAGISRSLFKRLRLLLSSSKKPIDKLSSFVNIVAEELQTDVCSCYLMKNQETLELFASFGLDKEAIHKTRLYLGEGLVGEIALSKKPLAVSDVWQDERFAYRPETKEDDFSSLMGVPLFKENQLLGVLAVQTREEYVYSPEEIELLETTSMILAEFIQSHLNDFALMEKEEFSSEALEGVPLSKGIALGTVVFHKIDQKQSITLFSKNPEDEKIKLTEAFESMRLSFESHLNKADIQKAEKDIFQTYLLFLKDKGWHKLIDENVKTGLSAEVSLSQATEEMCLRMRRLNDAYLRERSYDFEDLSQKILGYLSGENEQKKNKSLPENTILVASKIGPAELLGYDLEKIKALVLEKASVTMHVAIIAKSFSLPVISEIENVTSKLKEGEEILINAENGLIYTHPSEELIEEFKKQLSRKESLSKEYIKLKGAPCQTLDKTPIHLFANAGLAFDMISSSIGFAEGIGLYRTELPFMTKQKFPDIKEQIDIYKKALNTPFPVTFRTLDIGSDKALPYATHREEENPAMGWRSIRLTLDRRALLKGQLRAFIEAAEGKDFSVMFPMISNVTEFKEAKKTLQIELEKAKAKNIPIGKISVGTMIEVPSLVYELDDLLPLVDFISVGTNDLAQFIFAIDRTDPLIWTRYDTLSLSFLRVLKTIQEKASFHKVPCSVCGEIAGRPLEAMTLIGLGYRRLSMNIGNLGAVKNMILSLNKKELEEYLTFLLTYSKRESLRKALESFALDKEIKI